MYLVDFIDDGEPQDDLNVDLLSDTSLSTVPVISRDKSESLRDMHEELEREANMIQTRYRRIPLDPDYDYSGLRHLLDNEDLWRVPVKVNTVSISLSFNIFTLNCVERF